MGTKAESWALDLHPDAFDLTANQITPKLDPAGGLAIGPAGWRKSVDLLNGRGVLDPAGGTIPLPLITGPETTVNNGSVWNFGDYYHIVSDGTIGTAHVVAGGELPAFLHFNGSGDGTADAHWTLDKNSVVGGSAPTFHTLDKLATQLPSAGVDVDDVLEIEAAYLEAGILFAEGQRYKATVSPPAVGDWDLQHDNGNHTVIVDPLLGNPGSLNPLMDANNAAALSALAVGDFCLLRKEGSDLYAFAKGDTAANASFVPARIRTITPTITAELLQLYKTYKHVGNVLGSRGQAHGLGDAGGDVGAMLTNSGGLAFGAVTVGAGANESQMQIRCIRPLGNSHLMFVFESALIFAAP